MQIKGHSNFAETLVKMEEWIHTLMYTPLAANRAVTEKL